jgi:hypothetical protein
VLERLGCYATFPIRSYINFAANIFQYEPPLIRKCNAFADVIDIHRIALLVNNKTNDELAICVLFMFQTTITPRPKTIMGVKTSEILTIVDKLVASTIKAVSDVIKSLNITDTKNMFQRPQKPPKRSSVSIKSYR